MEQTNLNDLPVSSKSRSGSGNDVIHPEVVDDLKIRQKNLSKGLDVAKETLAVAKSITDILKIESEGKQKVNEIDACTRQIEVNIGGEVEKLRLGNEKLRDCGRIASELLKMHLTALDGTNMSDETKTALVKIIPEIIDKALNEVPKDQKA